MTDRNIKPIDETAAVLTVERDRNGSTQKIYKGSNYKAQSDEHKGGVLAIDIRTQAQALMDSVQRRKVDFNNLTDVQTRTFNYFAACSKAEVFPSMMGLAVHGYGISRQALNQYLHRHPDGEVTEFILMAKDVIADLLTNASLFNNANAAQVIFQLKNHFGHSDYQQELPPPEHTYEMTTERYRQEILKAEPDRDLSGMTDQELQSMYFQLKYKHLLTDAFNDLEDQSSAQNPTQ